MWEQGRFDALLNHFMESLFFCSLRKIDEFHLFLKISKVFLNFVDTISTQVPTSERSVPFIRVVIIFKKTYYLKCNLELTTVLPRK